MELFTFITPMVVLLLVLGVTAGIIFGAIPGMTATMALAIFLPLTYALNITEALSLLLGLYVGGISGGLVPAILLNIPGTPSSITTTFDGYPMAVKGEGKRALRIGVISSLFGGFLSLILLSLFTPVLSDVAMTFSYVEKFLIILFALSVIGSLSKGGLLGGLFSGVLGILISLIGAYSIGVGGNGKLRMVPETLKGTLGSGFSTLPVLIGLFALAVIFEEAEKGMKENNLGEFSIDDKEKFSLKEFKGQTINLFRSGLIGTFVGMLPGVGGSAASILSYSNAKNFSKNKSEFGTGAVSGLVASETANNGLTGGALIPLLSLGIPGDSTTAILIGAFTLQGINVGPLFISNNGETWSNMLVILFLANIIMFIIMFLAIKPISKVISIPKFVLFPIIAVMCVIGAYAVNYGIMFDVWSVFIFGLVGFFGKKLGLQIPSFLIGFILGTQAETYFIKSLESFGTYTIFFTKSPMAIVLWVMIITSFGYAIYSDRKEKLEKSL